LARAILFPGQGSQAVGMGRELVEASEGARRVFDRASEILGYDLAGICREGPAERLDRTDVCQPAILTTSMAAIAAITEDPSELRDLFHAAAGLSLGEYTALVFCGALGFDEALQLVRDRGRYMQECSERVASGMVSLVGTDEETAGRLCDRAREDGIASVANLNGGGQVVVSGDREAMDRVVKLAAEFGIRRVVPLRVAGAFHSEIMREAATRLEQDLGGVPIDPPRVTFYSNVTGGPAEDPQEIRRLLAEQVVRPVRWEPTILGMLATGIRRFLEPAPGKVLSGLLKKIDRDAEVSRVGSPDEARAVRAALGMAGSAEETA